MALPFFYISNYEEAQQQIVLDEDTSKHVVQVLRMNKGEQMKLTDGKGNLLLCEITDPHKKHCTVRIQSKTQNPKSKTRVTVAISLIKNPSRFEWFLEKATEIGVTEIIPLLCERTEKERFRYDRMKGICISAMLQSQQCWLPLLREPEQFKNLNNWKSETGSNFIAHCIDGDKVQLTDQPVNQSTLICIGPEGDFTSAEIELALQHQFLPVSLGDTRLRTETAGVVAATLLRLV